MPNLSDITPHIEIILLSSGTYHGDIQIGDYRSLVIADTIADLKTRASRRIYFLLRDTVEEIEDNW